MNYPVVSDSLDTFLSQLRSIKPLTPEREFELAVRYKETGEREAAHELVVSHLPFVVKIAFQHRNYQVPLQDLIQEGTIGLMKAVQSFDPHRGYRLVSFAVWWVKAYIKNFILNTWNLVKLGTTQAQRKLFFRIGSIGEHEKEEQRSARIKELADELKVKEDDVIETEARVKARDRSLHEAFGENKDIYALDLLEDHSPNQETMLLEQEREKGLAVATKNALKRLDPRERFIVRKRFMDDAPWTLQELGDHFGTSRERMRQIEKRALSKLRAQFMPQLAEVLAPA